MGRKHAAPEQERHEEPQHRDGAEPVQDIPASGGLDMGDRIVHVFAGLFRRDLRFWRGGPRGRRFSGHPGTFALRFLLFHPDIIDRDVDHPRGIFIKLIRRLKGNLQGFRVRGVIRREGCATGRSQCLSVEV